MEEGWIRTIANIILLCFQLAGQFGTSGWKSGSPSEKLQNEDLFDFIVVGGGTAGCAVSARLAEEGGFKVLLIERGGLINPESEIPALAPSFAGDPNIVTLYPTIPQLNAGLSRNGAFNVTIGNVLGGGSAINAQLLSRGSPHDYNNWGRLTGDHSWSYGRLLQYFKKYENYSGNFPSDQRGFNGPLPVESAGYAPGLAQLLQGGRELGYPVAESNGPQIISFANSDFTRRKGRRVSSYRANIEPLLWLGRSNLVVLMNTKVTRIVFEGNRAVGVRFSSLSNSDGFAKARFEVIVSAGAIDSAALLMRSGIGPKFVLDAAKIPVVRYLPVGQNLHDHPSASVTVVLGNRSLAVDFETELNPETFKLFEETGTGPYASFLGHSAQAFIASSVQPPHERLLGWPDTLLIMLHSGSSGILGGGVPVSDLKEWEVPVRWATYAGRPKSRGSVILDMRNIDGPPIIDYQFLAHPDDARMLMDGIKTYLRLCEETPTFQGLGCRVPTDKLPACAHLPFRSDPYWNCYVRHLTSVGYHNVGTCRMGSGPQDPFAVVDTQLRVIGTDCLRVVDASIMPAITNVNTMASVYVIAEKAAHMILQTWA